MPKVLPDCWHVPGSACGRDEETPLAPEGSQASSSAHSSDKQPLRAQTTGTIEGCNSPKHIRLQPPVETMWVQPAAEGSDSAVPSDGVPLHPAWQQRQLHITTKLHPTLQQIPLLTSFSIIPVTFSLLLCETSTMSIQWLAKSGEKRILFQSFSLLKCEQRCRLLFFCKEQNPVSMIKNPLWISANECLGFIRSTKEDL